MEFLAIAAFYVAVVFLLICVHELGHYLAGLIAGIPVRDMRIRLLRFPQHVQLRDADDWISPTTDIQRYVALTWRYLRTTPRVYMYVCGGLLLESAFTLTVGIVLLHLHRPSMAIAITSMSFMLLLSWVIFDSISVYRGRVTGDLSGMWQLARMPTCILLLIFLASRFFVLWIALSD